MTAGRLSYFQIILLGAAPALLFMNSCKEVSLKKNNGRSYYLNNYGNDSNDGNKTSPWKSITKLNSIKILPGDTVYFEAGHTFSGTIRLDSADGGSADHLAVITSTGPIKAVVNAGDSTALIIRRSKFMAVQGMAFVGSGRKKGNTKDGVILDHCQQIKVDCADIKGFQKSGLLINCSKSVDVKNVSATENGFAGIYAVGEWGKKNCSNIHISYCTAGNNSGDPSNLMNHSGNGILAGYCSNILIEYCSATNNGWDMPRKGNGPVGIWCFEADSVVIQHCISYKNKTAAGAADGGGFDLDGGVTNSVIQYCLSYDNEGSGYGLFQYSGAGNWKNNTIRYCISENDGSVSAAQAGVFIWNDSGDSNQLANCYFYNNTIYNTKGAAIRYEAKSSNSGFQFYNNIFVAKDSLVTGRETKSTYLGNNWYSLKGGFSMGRFTDLKTWANTEAKEIFNDELVGHNSNPLFAGPGSAAITDPAILSSFNNYQLHKESVLLSGGLDLQQLFKINNGGKNFRGQNALQRCIGAQ